MIREFSLFLLNKPGQLSGALRALAEAKVNVQAFSIEQAGAYSVVRLICNKIPQARKQLRKHAYGFTETDVFAIHLWHEPGELERVADLFGRNSVNIEYGYLTLVPKTTEAIVIIKADEENEEKAKKLLRDNNLKDCTRIPDQAAT